MNVPQHRGMEHLSELPGGLYLAAYTVPAEGESATAVASVCTGAPRCPQDHSGAVLTVRAGPFLEPVTALVIAIDYAAQAWDRQRLLKGAVSHA